MLERNQFAEPSEGHGISTSPDRRARILTVDDDVRMLDVLQEGLMRAGYECTTARSADEASRLLERQEFDLVLLDIIMPGKSGLEFLPEIKARYPNTAVVMLTGHVEVPSVVTAMRQGTYDYICKPFALSELRTCIERALVEHATLRQDREHQQNHGEQLEQRIRETTWLLNEVNHRAKNNLQTISSLLSLQSRDIQDEQVLRSIKVSQDRIKAMGLVHEKLLQSDDLARIDFGEYIKSLATDLGCSYGLDLRDINLKIDVENILLGVETAIPCGVIVNELVANSLKHAFPGDRSGEIAISFRAIDGQYSMIFKDDGVGFSEDLDISCQFSLGLSIVNAFTRQLGGAIEFVRNGGSEVRITFPAE